MLSATLLLPAACISDREPAGPLEEVAACEVPLHAIRRGDLIVLIRGFAFTPDTLSVKAGQTVTWVNCETPETESHTTTGREQAWSSPLLSRGQSFSHTFQAAGTFDYFCLPHSIMRATVVVE